MVDSRVVFRSSADRRLSIYVSDASGDEEDDIDSDDSGYETDGEDTDKDDDVWTEPALENVGRILCALWRVLQTDLVGEDDLFERVGDVLFLLVALLLLCGGLFGFGIAGCELVRLIIFEA